LPSAAFGITGAVLVCVTVGVTVGGAFVGVIEVAGVELGGVVAGADTVVPAVVEVGVPAPELSPLEQPASSDAATTPARTVRIMLENLL
jgi:hypothetical protein